MYTIQNTVCLRGKSPSPLVFLQISTHFTATPEIPLPSPKLEFVKLDVKAPGSTWELHLKLANSSLGEGSGISGVAVKCAEI